jgi:signal transduction histidine kinase
MTVAFRDDIDSYKLIARQSAITALLHNMRDSAIVLTLFPLLVVYALWEDVPHPLLFSWLAAAGLVALARWLIYLNRHRVDLSREHSLWWRSVIVLASATSGLLWGLTAVLFHSQASTGPIIVLNVVVVGLAAGSTVASNYWLPYFFAFTIPNLSIYGFYYLFSGGKAGLILAALFFIYLLMLANLARFMNRTYRKNLDLSLKNEALVEQLKHENAVVEAVSQAKTRFFASASHDLRQPVHSLSLLREALEYEITGSRGKELIALVGTAVDALDQLLGSLLDISKLDAGVIEPTIIAVPLRPLIDSLINEMQPHAWEKGLQLRQYDCEHLVATDPNLLSNILRNLLTNAIRYTDRGGVLIACRRRRKQLLVQVWDTGIGIAPEDQEKVFHEFTQLHNPERDRNKGLGLGLAICLRLTRLLGYPLSLRSRPQHGSVFTLRIPQTIDKSVLASQVAETVSTQWWDMRGRTLLVIDDEPTVRQGMEALLGRWGCCVLSAGSAADALQQAQDADFQIDAIIADYRLPDNINGAEAAAAIIKMARRVIPVVLVTGDTSPERIQEARASGHPLLHKPVKPAFLRSTIGKVLAVVPGIS